MKIRGKKLTVAQRKTLEQHGFTKEMLEDCLLQKITHLEEGTKHLSKEGSKEELWTIVSRKTGQVQEINIGEV